MLKVLRKIFVLTLMFATIFSTCQAAQIRLSNMNAENFLNSMATLLKSDKIRQLCPVAITDLIRDEKSDMPEYNLTGWSALFAGDMSSPPEGYVTFYTDSMNCVYSMKFTFKITSDWAKKYEVMLLSTMWALGSTPNEAGQLITGGKTENGIYFSDVRLSAQNKICVLMMNKINDMVVVLLMATDGQK